MSDEIKAHAELLDDNTYHCLVAIVQGAKDEP